MGKIESIKQKICQLDAGSFQNLCDSYLYKIGYPNIVSLGGEAGTRKTTPGTPDTYFISPNGKYIFVEYTTQKERLFAKIKDDISKCLNISKTGITHDKISEIIYCHTSSNLTPFQDNKIKNLCKNAGIKLTIIGIDKLAEDIYLMYPILARDFLDISISTGQIQEPTDFIKYYNSNKIAAPIDTKFLFREKELKKINKAYLKADVVILTGMAGAGKTRLALHYVENRIRTCDEKVFCIHDNALPIYEDLKHFIDSPGNYFLFIDDANQLSGLQHIVRYANMKPEGYSVKILITVRDYALQKVINNVREITSYEIVKINIFSDDQIKQLLQTSLDILNQDYQERIIRIAEGNARIAILAGRVACSSNRLDSIDDVSQLYEEYYGFILKDDRMIADKNLYYIMAGVVAFLEALHLDHIDALLPILQGKGIDRERFIENIRMLHEHEIIDIYNDKAVRFSDQCLSNYLLKYVFFDKRLLDFSKMVKVCFLSYRARTISSVNTLLNVFKNVEVSNFVEKEIKKVWDELATEKSPVFFEFVKVFFFVSPTETLMILQNKIDSEEDITCKWCDIDTKKGKNYQHVTNEIIETLGGFADMQDLPTACDLFFQYYLKRPDLYVEFYHAVNSCFGIRKDSARYDYFTQITFFEKIKEYSDNWKRESVVFLFLKVAGNFLKGHFSPAELGRKDTFAIYQVTLTISEGVKKYRQLIWEFLISLCKIEKYKEKVRKILSSYNGNIKTASIPVIQFDLIFIDSILKSYFSPDELENCIMVDKLAHVFNRMNIPCKSLFAVYFKGKKFQLYRLLKGPDDKIGIDYRESKKLKQQSIKKYVSNCNLRMFKELIDVCKDIAKFDDNAFWQLGEGLGIAFDAISQQKDLYVDAIKYYIKNDTPNNLPPDHLVDTLFSLLSDAEVYQIINSGEYSQKNAWIYAYYHELPPDLISKNHLQELYSFLKDTSDKDITFSAIRDVDFLDKYNRIDPQAFIKGCKIILAKMEYSPFIVHIYFASLFTKYCNAPKKIISKFNSNLELLEEVYCAMLSCNNHLDDDGQFIIEMYKEIYLGRSSMQDKNKRYYYEYDYDGQFLKEIYLVKPSILDKYISYLTNRINRFFRDYQKRKLCFFCLDDFIEIYDKIFDQLMKNCDFPEKSVPCFLESLLLPIRKEPDLLERQDKWIRQCIQRFSNDKAKMYCLFSVVSKLEIGRKKGYILLFLEKNPLFEDFKRIPLIPTLYSWSGSAIPVYSAWIEFLESLQSNLVGLKWLKHKQYIERRINTLKKEIESEQIDEIIEG